MDCVKTFRQLGKAGDQFSELALAGLLTKRGGQYQDEVMMNHDDQSREVMSHVESKSIMKSE